MMILTSRICICMRVSIVSLKLHLEYTAETKQLINKDAFHE